MVQWDARSTVYKVSLFFSYMIFLLYGLAFSIPLWLRIPNTNGTIGLWADAIGDSSDIDSIDGTGFGKGVLSTDWFDAVRGLWVAGMALYLFGVVASLVENCCLSAYSKDYGISGILILLAGLCGGAGIILTAVENEDRSLSLDYMWGYMIAVIASGLAVICSIVLLISKNFNIKESGKTSRTADYVYGLNKSQRPYGPDYNNPAFRGDDIPMSNGLSNYHHHHHPTTPYNQSPYSMYRTGHENGFGGSKYEQGSGYYPYGYKEQGRPGNRISIAESADLSNGYTPDIVHAENTLGRRGDYGNRNQYHPSGEFYYNGGSRPY